MWFPERTKEPWFKEFMACKDKRWRILVRILKGAHLFQRPHAHFPYDETKRCASLPSLEVMYVCVFNDKDTFSDWNTYDLQHDYRQKREEHEKAHMQITPFVASAPAEEETVATETQIQSTKVSRHNKHLEKYCYHCKKTVRSDVYKLHLKKKFVPKGRKLYKCDLCNY